MHRNRRALKLVDHCAVDHPELGAVWFEEGWWGQVALLAAYLERRIAEGRLRAVPTVPIAEPDAEQAVVDLLVHAFAKERRR